MKNNKLDIDPKGKPSDKKNSGETPPVKEIGGRNDPDPTRYNDWEKDGRCVDF